MSDIEKSIEPAALQPQVDPTGVPQSPDTNQPHSAASGSDASTAISPHHAPSSTVLAKLPPHLTALFIPQYMSNDDADMYWRLLDYLVEHFKPADYGEFVLLRDSAMVDNEVLKLQRMKAAVIDKCRKEACVELLKFLARSSIGEENWNAEMERRVEVSYISLRTEKEMIAELSRHIADPEITLATQTAQLIAKKDAETIANLDKLIAAAERRRNAALAELTRGRERKARLVEKLLKLSKAFAEQLGWGDRNHSRSNDDTSPDSGQST
jgi:hypothetical protein